jgi:hypothetical protein
MGYYRLENLDGYWSAFGPDDEPVYLLGMNHVGDGSVYPSDFDQRFRSRQEWVAQVRERLAAWGFNYLGPTPAAHSHSREYLPPEQRGGRLVRTDDWDLVDFDTLDYPFSIMLDYPGVREFLGRKGSTYPDVFSNEFRETLDKHCERICSALKDHPNLVGYHYTHNPPWSYIDLGPEPDLLTWIRPIVREYGSAARQKWISVMRRIYGTPERYQRVYYHIKDFSDIEAIEVPDRGCGNCQLMRKDQIAFIREVAREWYRVYHDTIRRYDPNHLLLGDRMTIHRSIIPSYVLEIMYPYVDALSFNMMGPAEQMMDNLREPLTYWDKPIFAADVGGRVYDGKPDKSGGLVSSYEELEQFYWDHIRLGIEHPQIIGLAWCGYWETTVHHSGLVYPHTNDFNQDMAQFMQSANDWAQAALAERVGAHPGSLKM